jgi:DNA-binding NarL/FixJ family response regulator
MGIGNTTSGLNREVSKKIRIVLVDVSLLFRQALRAYVEKQQDMEIIAEGGDGNEAMELCAKLRPNVVITDTHLPLINGLEVTRRIAEKYPDTKVLIVSAHEDDETVLRTLQAGASGYLMKKEPAEVIIHVVRVIANGNKEFRRSSSDAIYIDSTQKTEPLKNNKTILTSKEEAILKLVASGLQNKSIAHDLGLSLPYVKASLSTIYIKLGASSRTEAILMGLKSGVLSVNDFINT